MFNAALGFISRSLAVLVVSLGLACTAAAQNAAVAPEDVDMGVIQEIDFSKNQMVVSGNVYDVVTTAKVEIGGSYGAFTMLSTGMRIEFHYKKFADGVRQIFEIRELGSNEEMEEA